MVKKYPYAKVQRVKDIWDFMWLQAERLVDEKKHAASESSSSDHLLPGKDILSVLGQS